MTSRMEFSSLDEVKQAVSTHFSDSELENAIAHFLRSAEEVLSLQCLEYLLTHENAKVRALGLRIVQRVVRDSSLMETVVQLSFDVKRLSELQYWYSAILNKYSLELFGNRLCSEISKRADAEFSARNIRALEMHRVSDLDRKRQVLERVRESATNAGRPQI